MTLLHLDPDSWVPPFEQLRTQITEQAHRGLLPPGHRLPPVRRLAADLGIAPNTVARAYRELEHAGIVETRGRHGTFIAPPATHGRDAVNAALQAAAAYAQQILALGLDPDHGTELARRALNSAQPSPTAP